MKEREREAIMENVTDEGRRDDDRADDRGMTAKRHRPGQTRAGRKRKRKREEKREGKRARRMTVRERAS